MAESQTQIVNGAGGRRIIQEPGRPARVALPVNVAEQALTVDEKRILVRFIDASELARGNYAVAEVNGEPRGRFAQYAERVSLTQYASFEIDAFRWIQGKAFGKENCTLSEVIARISGERSDLTFEQFGAYLANDDDEKIARGAAIGALRALAWSLKDAYRDYYELWSIRQRAANEGRALSDDEAARRVRRDRSVRMAFQSHKPQLMDNSSES